VQKHFSIRPTLLQCPVRDQRLRLWFSNFLLLQTPFTAPKTSEGPFHIVNVVPIIN